MPRSTCCGGRGPSKSKNEQADRKARQHDIVEHDAEAGGDDADGEQHDRRPHQVQRRNHQRDDAEHRILEKHRRDCARLADQRLQAGVTGEADGRVLDAEIAQIDCIADGHEADDDQELHLVGREAEGLFCHGRNMVGMTGGGNRRGGYF